MKLTLTLLGIAFSCCAMCGTFSYSIGSGSWTGSTQNVTLDTSDTQTAVLTVLANSATTQTSAQASVPITIVYTPAAGETNLPTVAYVEFGFSDSFNSTSTADTASVLSVVDNATIVDQVLPADFPVINGSGDTLGASHVSIPLTLNSDGTLSGTYTATGNKLVAGVATGTSDVSTVSQVLTVNQVSASPLTDSVVREVSNAATGPHIIVNAGTVRPNGYSFTVRPYPPNYPFHPWPVMTTHCTCNDVSKGNVGELDANASLTGSPGRGDGFDTFGFLNVNETIEVTVLVKSAIVIVNANANYAQNITYSGSCSYSASGPGANGSAGVITDYESLSAGGPGGTPGGSFSHVSKTSGYLAVSLTGIDGTQWYQGTNTYGLALSTLELSYNVPQNASIAAKCTGKVKLTFSAGSVS